MKFSSISAHKGISVETKSVTITREDVLKLGKISNISINEDEIALLVKSLQDVLSCASYLKDIAAQIECPPMPKNANITREDTVIPTAEEPILAQAPQREDHYFVVPVILKN